MNLQPGRLDILLRPRSGRCSQPRALRALVSRSAPCPGRLLPRLKARWRYPRRCPASTATAATATSQLGRRRGGADGRGGADTNRRGGDGAGCCGGGADGHGWGESDGHCGAGADGHGGEEADGGGGANCGGGEEADGGGGGANCGGGEAGCRRGAGAASHGAVGRSANRRPAPVTGSPRPGCEPGLGPLTRSLRSATARPPRWSRRRRRTGSTPPVKAAHTTGTSEPRSLPILAPPWPASPATESASVRRRVITRLQSWTRLSSAGLLTACWMASSAFANRRRVSHPRHQCLPSALAPGPAAIAPGQTAAQTEEFIARRIAMTAFWAQHARSPKLPPNPNPRPASNQPRPGRNVTQIICLVTVTCHGNGAAAPARPAIPDLPRTPAAATASASAPRTGQAHGARRGRQTGRRSPILTGRRSPIHCATGTVPGPGRVALRPGKAAAPASSRHAVPEALASRPEGKSR